MYNLLKHYVGDYSGVAIKEILNFNKEILHLGTFFNGHEIENLSKTNTFSTDI